ncbi:MAG: Cdc6/Cdc18 family protein, partial [Candidatus Heimdallarchaeaceae archaeon]
PIDCLCHGKPGTGKTVLVKYVLKQLEENTNTLAFYVNCWENKTLTQVLDQMLKQVRLPVVDSDHSVKISRLKNKIKRKPLVIALDEVDKLSKKELNDVLYVLKNLGKVGIICISNTRKYFLTLDPRITSRFSFKSVNFSPYSNEELFTILKQRVVDCRALYPNTWSKKVLEQIADLSAGDARIAIQTLRNAAYIAEKLDKSKITKDEVEKAYEEVMEIKKKYMLEKLGAHHKLIYEIVKKNPGITSHELLLKYRNECQEMSLMPKSERSLTAYINDLISLHYVNVERAKARGNVRKFFPE